MGIDRIILDFIQTYMRCGFLDMAMPIITKLGDKGIFWIICSLLLILFPKTRKAGITMAVSLGLEALCCNVLLKPLVARTRPFDVNTTLQLLIPRPDDFSFPSGHTGASFAAASTLLFGKNRMGPPALILAALIGFSRLYLYVHYPTDVLAGAALGILFGWIGNTVVEALRSQRRQSLS